MNAYAEHQAEALPFQRRLAFRIFGLFLGLLLLVQLVTFGLVQRSINTNSLALLSSSLDMGELVFKRLLSQSATHLNESTRLVDSFRWVAL